MYQKQIYVDVFIVCDMVYIIVYFSIIKYDLFQSHL